LREEVSKISSNLDLANPDFKKDEETLTNVQAKVNELKASIADFLNKNQKQLDQNLATDRASFTQEAKDLVQKSQTDIINKLSPSSIIDPGLQTTKDSLLNDAKQLINNINILQNSVKPTITQIVLDDKKTQLTQYSNSLATLKQHLTSLTKSNSDYISSRKEVIRNQTTSILNSIDKELTLPANFKALPSLEGEQTALQTKLNQEQRQLREEVSKISSNLDLANPDFKKDEETLTNVQAKVNELKASIADFLNKNQKQLDQNLATDRASFTQEAKDLVQKSQTDIINKLSPSSIIDPGLQTTKDSLLNDAKQLINNINILQNSVKPTITQIVLDDKKTQLTQYSNSLATLKQRLTSLTKSNSDYISSQKEAVKNQTTSILNSIDKELTLPANFKAVSSLEGRQTTLQTKLNQEQCRLRKEVGKIISNLDLANPDFKKNKETLTNAQKDVNTLKASIQSLVQDNQAALLQEQLRQEKEKRKQEEEHQNIIKQKIKDWVNKFDILYSQNQILSDAEFNDIKNKINEEIISIKQNLNTNFNEENAQKAYNELEKRITENLSIQEQERQIIEKQNQALQLELKSLQENPAVYIDETPFMFNDKEFSVDILRQHIERNNILKSKESTYKFAGYVDSEGNIIPKGTLTLSAKDFVKIAKTQKLPKSGTIIADIDDEQNPYIVTLNVTYSKNRSLFNVNGLRISDDQIPYTYTLKIIAVKKDENLINSRIDAEKKAKKEERKRKEAKHNASCTAAKDFVAQYPPVYVNSSSQSSFRLGFSAHETMKKILPPQIDGFKFFGYANSGGNLHKGELLVYHNHQVVYQVASENSALGKSGTKKITFSVGDATYTMKIKSELKSTSIPSTGIRTKVYFVEIVPGSIEVEKKRAKKEKEEKSKCGDKERERGRKSSNSKEELRGFFRKHH